MHPDRLLDGRLKLRHLVLATTIAEQGTIIGAAEALHVTQPVVTRGLHDLETVLGVSLFDRHPRGVTPTLYGATFLEHAQSVLAQIRQAGEQITMLQEGDLGAVTIGIHLAGSNILLPTAIAALKAEHPNVTVTVREGTPDALQNDLLAGHVDLVVGRLTGTASHRLIREPLYVEPIRLAARRSHPVHRLHNPGLSELVDYPWILPVGQTALRSELEDVFAAEGISLPLNRIECTSILTVQHLLRTTDVIAVLPVLITTSDNEVELISTPLKGIGRAVGVTLPSDRALPPAAEIMRRHLHDEAATLQRTLRPR